MVIGRNTAAVLLPAQKLRRKGFVESTVAVRGKKDVLRIRAFPIRVAALGTANIVPPCQISQRYNQPREPRLPFADSTEVGGT